MTKTDALRRNRIRRFVKTTIEVRRQPELLPETATARIIPMGIVVKTEAAGVAASQSQEAATGHPGFYTSPIYRARDFDPL